MWAVNRNCYQRIFQTNPTQKTIINHFPNHFQITRKDLLALNLTRHAFTFLPTSFVLPSQWQSFKTKFEECTQTVTKVKKIWILKPADKARGLGITLINSLNQIPHFLQQQEPLVQSILQSQHVAYVSVVSKVSFLTTKW